MADNYGTANARARHFATCVVGGCVMTAAIFLWSGELIPASEPTGTFLFSAGVMLWLGTWVAAIYPLGPRAIRFSLRPRTLGRNLAEWLRSGDTPLHITRPPGNRLDAFASFVFKKRVYETVLKPNLAEMQEEYYEALSKGEMSKAQWVRIRGVFEFWCTVGLQVPVSLTRLVKRIWMISDS